MADEVHYCRLCAQPRRAHKLQQLDPVQHKLHALNVLMPGDRLPQTACFLCLDALDQAYQFLEKVRRAQEVLVEIFSPKLASDDSKLTQNDLKLTNDEFKVTSDELKLESKVSKLAHNASEDDFYDDVLADCSQSPEPVVELKVKTEPEDKMAMAVNVQDFLDAMPLSLYGKVVKEDVASMAGWAEYPWVCALCSIEFTSIEMLRSHATLVHGKCCAHYCVDCEAPRKDDFRLFVKHVRKHREHLRNFCYYCHCKVESLSDLKLHLEQHYPSPRVPCPLCGDILDNEDALRTHLTQYSTQKLKKQPRRKRGTPITIEELTCKLCKKVYKNPNSLRDHMKLHTNNRKKDYTCDRCGKMFYNKGTLTSHIMSHDKIRPHLCRICNRSFLYPNMLRRHVEMHSGVKPFSCEQCGRCFRLQYQLNAHKIVHTDSLPYICQYCNKAFRFKQILKNHERQHTGAKPYACQTCGMEFTNWSNYNKHMKRRHNTDTSKKKITPEGVFPINPETGQILQIIDSAETEEWKSKIMIPVKRGKKKVIKQEQTVS